MTITIYQLQKFSLRYLKKVENMSALKETQNFLSFSKYNTWIRFFNFVYQHQPLIKVSNRHILFQKNSFKRCFFVQREILVSKFPKKYTPISNFNAWYTMYILLFTKVLRLNVIQLFCEYQFISINLQIRK